MKNRYKISVATLGVFLVGSALWLNQGNKPIKNYTLAENTFKHQSLTKTKLAVIPQPKIVRVDENNELNVNIAPKYGNKFRKEHDAFFKWLDSSFSQFDGNTIELNVTLRQNAVLPDSLNSLLDHNEAYYLGFKNDQITVVGHDTLGVLNGLTTLKKYLEFKKGRINEGYIIDWPDHQVRAFHFVARSVSEEQTLNLLKRARENQFNTLVVQLADEVELRNTGIPARKDAWSEEFLQGISKQAREYGIQFIPEIKLLSHQEKFFKKAFPELMYNNKTYDPTNNRTKKIVQAYLDRIISLTKPEAIHIGHDEVKGIYKPYSARSSRKIPGAEKALPAKLFQESILFLYEFLEEKGVETWMWGDMFLKQKRFPGMFKWSLHANKNYEEIINNLPKDIIICDWHYWDNQTKFPSVDFFTEKGFRVVGSTWKKEHNINNFSKYVDSRNPKGIGMMATTWFHVQRQENEMIDQILTTSSENFWNAK